MRYQLPIHSYQHSSRPVGAERLVNCFAEQAPAEGKSPTVVMRAPGIVAITSGGDASFYTEGRGIYTWKGIVYAVLGEYLYKLTSSDPQPVYSPSYTSVGGPISGSGRVSWAVTPTQLVINANPDTYVYDGTTLTQVTDADYTARGGASASSIDGYVLFREPNSGRFFSSDLNDAKSYDALMFATAEGEPDELVGMIADHRQLILAGPKTMELWYNAGSAGFPFIRDTNGFLEIGCAAGDSLTRVDNSVMWLASDWTVRRLDGLTPVRISQHGVEQAISSYTVKSDAIGITYTQDGHVFYVLTFPTEGHTWVYDCTTKEWHERETYELSYWSPVAMTYAFDKIVVLSKFGSMGYLSTEAYEDEYVLEFPIPQVASFTFANGKYNNGKRTFHSLLEIMAETGVGLTTGQGSAPEIMLEMSYDGGRTWRSAPNKSLGAIGRYRDRVRWHKLGSTRDRIYRCTVSDPVKFTVSDAALETVG